MCVHDDSQVIYFNWLWAAPACSLFLFLFSYNVAVNKVVCSITAQISDLGSRVGEFWNLFLEVCIF